MQIGSVRMYILTATVSEPGNYTCEAITTTNFSRYNSVSQVSIGIWKHGKEQHGSLHIIIDN